VKVKHFISALYFPGTFNVAFAYDAGATVPDKAWIVLNYGDGSPDTTPVPWTLTYTSPPYSYAASGHYYTTITVYNLASSVTRKLLVFFLNNKHNATQVYITNNRFTEYVSV